LTALKVYDQPRDKTTHTARVAYLSDDVVGCFAIMEQGVKGTIVEMPDNCSPKSFARAISLEISDGKSVLFTTGG
jgi:chitinase